MKYYVNARVPHSGDGTCEKPFRTISEAARQAQPGDEVIVLPGIYREYVNPPRGGVSERERITYRAEQPGTAVITGSEEIKGWTHVQDDIWSVTLAPGFFGSCNPYTTEIYGDWYRGLGRINHTGQVYFDGKALVEEGSLEDLKKKEPLQWAWDQAYSARYKWCSCQENGNTILYACFPDGNPNDHCVEINMRPSVFFPDKTGINYITVAGFVLRHAATQWAPPTAFQEGLIGPHWSKGWIIEDCEISGSRCVGVSLGKCMHPSNNRWTTDKVKSGTQLQRDMVLYAQHTGWSKETVGSHIVRGCHIHDCGQAGIVGHLGGAFCLIENNHIHHINTSGEFSGSELGGIKLHAAIDTIIRHNHIHHNHRGIWLDWEVQGTRVTQNLFHDNTGEEDVRTSEDLYIEVSHGPTLVDNNLFLSPFPLRERSQGMAFVHNIIAGPIDKGDSQGRFTPYHFPHETDVMGVNTINGGDDRFYNNIFIQPVFPEERKHVLSPELAVQVGSNPEVNLEAGLHIYDSYPLPEEYAYLFSDEGTADTAWGRQYDYSSPFSMYVAGNVYLNGAKPYAKETNRHLDTNEIFIKLTEENGQVWLETNLYDTLPEMETPFVSTQLLGKAFEPEQPFENPDGSEIRIDEDYDGNKRGIHPTPGPFESWDGNKRRIW